MPTLPKQKVDPNAPDDTEDRVVAGTSPGRVSSVSEVPNGGYSMGFGKGFNAYHYDVTATGGSSRNAQSVNTQSFYIVAGK